MDIPHFKKPVKKLVNGTVTYACGECGVTLVTIEPGGIFGEELNTLDRTVIANHYFDHHGEPRLIEGVELILSGKPLPHSCENCGDVGMSAVDALPSGWRYLITTDKPFESLDEVDEKTLLICPICFGLVTRVIKKLQ